MRLEEQNLIGLLMVFCRISACFLVSPVFGSQTPVLVRIFICGALTAAVGPVVAGQIHEHPVGTWGMGMLVIHEIGVGILIGSVMALLMQALQMGGAMADLQLGLSSMQVFNPMAGTVVSVFSNLKFWLGMIILLMINGHHLMISALVESYRMVPGPGVTLTHVPNILSLVGQITMLAVQIVSPTVAAALIVDLSAGVINKSVPQMQVYMVALPAKVLIGLFALIMSLPILVQGVTSGVDHAFSALQEVLSHGVKT